MTATLSDDAKALAACHFGLMGEIGKSQIVFHMVEYRPTARCKAALEELVAAGILTVERDINLCGGVRYTLAKDCSEYRRFANRGNFAMAEPIPASEQRSDAELRRRRRRRA